MGDFTRAGDIEHEVPIPIKIGDLYIDRASLDKPYPIGRAWVVDTHPYGGAPTKVCIEHSGGAREWHSVAELRKRFSFRKAAV